MDKEEFEKIDSMKNLDIKKAIITKYATLDGMKLDEQSEDYINARFDGVAERIKDSTQEKQLLGKKTATKKEDSEEVVDHQADYAKRVMDRNNKDKK